MEGELLKPASPLWKKDGKTRCEDVEQLQEDAGRRYNVYLDGGLESLRLEEGFGLNMMCLRLTLSAELRDDGVVSSVHGPAGAERTISCTDTFQQHRLCVAVFAQGGPSVYSSMQD